MVLNIIHHYMSGDSCYVGMNERVPIHQGSFKPITLALPFRFASIFMFGCRYFVPLIYYCIMNTLTYPSMKLSPSHHHPFPTSLPPIPPPFPFHSISVPSIHHLLMLFTIHTQLTLPYLRMLCTALRETRVLLTSPLRSSSRFIHTSLR